MEKCDDPLTGWSCVVWPAAIGHDLSRERFPEARGLWRHCCLHGPRKPALSFGAAIIAIFVECVGGIGLVIGYQTRLTGTILAVWCIATAFVDHADFSDTDQMINFLKNVAMAGGFLQLVAFGAGLMRDAARLRRGTIERSVSLEERGFGD
jgi:hypothetical protein